MGRSTAESGLKGRLGDECGEINHTDRAWRSPAKDDRAACRATGPTASASARGTGIAPAFSPALVRTDVVLLVLAGGVTWCATPHAASNGIRPINTTSGTRRMCFALIGFTHRARPG